MPTTVDAIRENLRQLGLDTRGNKSAVKARLRKHLKKEPGASRVPATSAVKAPSLSPSAIATSTSRAITSTAAELTESLSGTTRQGKEESSVEDTKGDVDADIKVNKGQSQNPPQSPKKVLHKNSRYDYYLCFDVEATCEKGFSFEFPNEVIEFPVVLLDGSSLEIVNEFHSYVRPTNRPILSDFCKELTGITQETIDNAPTFTEVLALFEDWLKKHNIILGDYTPDREDENQHQQPKKTRTKKNSKFHNKNNNGNIKNPLHHKNTAATNDFTYGATFRFVTDGPFDIRDFIGKQCLHSGIPRPSYFAQSYIDVRTMFREFFDLIHWRNLEGMLDFMGQTFTGRQHSGICDARMVALITRRLAEGFSQDDEDPVFREGNSAAVSPKWSNAKMAKFKGGCVLKANRSTDQTYVKMLSFKKLETIEALPAALVAAGVAASAVPKPKKDPLKQDGKVTPPPESSSFHPKASLPSPTSPVSSSSPKESFVTESKYAALIGEPE
ncbi:hypothetical protein BG011_003837 [Mortierella polycephala]|uniref:SAP domain-containing protein n=1 Tax=Mortierella polycephala TaxID=41804 RepID=A0A9P6PZZ4_9FUNG|nr:hypothetical protein BG011_003837 [Mortierella polycephala]